MSREAVGTMSREAVGTRSREAVGTMSHNSSARDGYWPLVLHLDVIVRGKSCCACHLLAAPQLPFFGSAKCQVSRHSLHSSQGDDMFLDVATSCTMMTTASSVCLSACLCCLLYLLFALSVRLINHHHHHPRRRIYHQLPCHQGNQIFWCLEHYHSK